MTIGNAGDGRRPEPPFDPQDTEGQPGIESKLDPRPQYRGRDYRAAGKLEGEVALITGGDSGIGRAVAVLFAREGANIAIAYLDEDRDAEETRARVEREGAAVALRADGDRHLALSGRVGHLAVVAHVAHPPVERRLGRGGAGGGRSRRGARDGRQKSTSRDGTIASHTGRYGPSYENLTIPSGR